MAMYANVQWTRVAKTAQQPVWAVWTLVWDEAGKIVYDEKGNPVVATRRISPASAVSAQQQLMPPIPVVLP